jgi:7-cyano-7-deazaguanine synthase
MGRQVFYTIPAMERAVCLVSGGLDSCVAAATARAEGFEPAFLHVGYGQRTQRRELEAFNALADYYRVGSRLMVKAEYLGAIGGSALTDPSIPCPEGDPRRAGIPITYVPFRNANLLSIAVSWAEVLGVRLIFIGAVEEDGSGYPDCRESFLRAFNAAIRKGTRPESGIRVVAPLIHSTKGQIVARGIELGAPFELTWSCYRNLEVACGRCDSCVLRLKGFADAGIEDPLPYAAAASRKEPG